MNYMRHSSETPTQTQFEGRGAAKNMPNVTDDPMCSENPPLFVALDGAFRDACERAPRTPLEVVHPDVWKFSLCPVWVRRPTRERVGRRGPGGVGVPTTKKEPTRCLTFKIGSSTS